MAMHNHPRQSSSPTRAETLRRISLYGISSKKRFPRVHLEPHDARTRKDLQLLTTLHPQNQLQHCYEDELNDRKHREHLTFRPPMDQIQSLGDLHTTVAKDLRNQQASKSPHQEQQQQLRHGRGWRVGYQNHVDTNSRGSLNGMFEPFEGMREQIDRQHQQQTTMATTSVTLAYPVAPKSPSRIETDMQPFDEEAEREKEAIKATGGVIKSPTKAPWCPASSKQTPTQKMKTKKKNANNQTSNLQPFPVRKVVTTGEGTPANRAKKPPLTIDPHCLEKRQSLLANVAQTYNKLRKQIDKYKDPGLRYALPIEDPKSVRAYRLGLEPVPSSTSPSLEDPSFQSSHIKSEDNQPRSTHKRPSFRPKSAVSIPFTLTCKASQGNPLYSASISATSNRGTAFGKVAGAKRRPHSASVYYLGSSTVYCMSTLPVSASNQPHYQDIDQQRALMSSDSSTPTNFHSILEQERHRRRLNQQQTFGLLSKRAMFHNLPVPQIFARLRREALKNLTRRVQCAKYENMSMEEYMMTCGMTSTTILSPNVGDSGLNSNAKNENNNSAESNVAIKFTDISQPHHELANLEIALNHPGRAVTVDSSTTPPGSSNDSSSSSSLAAMRNVLVVTRQQFHIAAETLNLALSDVNLLFSALDVDVTDQVPVWEILCAIEKIQDGHTKLRRSRVHVKPRDLHKDLDVLRNSIVLPNRRHIPVEEQSQEAKG